MVRNYRKSILVTYVNVEKIPRYKACVLLTEVDNYIRRQFESADRDRTMAFLTLPSDHTEVKVFRQCDLKVSDEEIQEVQNKIKEMLNK